MAKFISSAESLLQINQRLSKPISKQQFRTIYALMEADGIATPSQPRQSGWVLSDELWKWSVYLATRENLIKAGKWSTKRPYSIQDMEDIALMEMYQSYQPEEITNEPNPPTHQR